MPGPEPVPGSGAVRAEGPLPFFVYGTLRPGEYNHDRYVRGLDVREQPALLHGGALYDGPGYPFATDGDGTVHGALITAAPEEYGGLLAALDRLETYLGPEDPRNLYERVARDVEVPGSGTVRAWVYLAASAVLRTLRASGPRIPGGDWLDHRPPRPAPDRRTP
ncbi:gamma-glutamylcyclotransferase [Streptomyces sp. NBC_00247]|uniref:gamma-glutamylcyclotransferase family protein n=1 Tax=Streptomyces sp. NBC_00247 TaxID=2975689 RepID=UPI002E2CA0F9|nr:gamma-glutamylcyclotransferase family protein [Streptomyces sp. NBC_00247]